MNHPPRIPKPLLWLAAAVTVMLAPALAAVEPHWSQLTVNGKPATVAQTNLMDVAFDAKGEIVGWFVKVQKGADYKGNYTGKPNLIAAPSAIIAGTGLTPAAAPSAPETTVEPGEGSTKTLVGTFRYTAGGHAVTRTYRIASSRYTVGVTTRVDGVNTYTLAFTGLGNAQPGVKLLQQGASAPVAGNGSVNALGYAAFQGGGSAFIVRPASTGSGLAAGKTLAAATGTVNVPAANGQSQQKATLTLTLPGSQDVNLDVYGGQNELVRLDLEHLASEPGLFQPNILGTLSLALIRLMQFLRSITGSWGLAIILLTVVIRSLIWPLMQVQMKSTAEMQALQPKINEINKKYKDNAEKKSQATMALYKEHNVNPGAGCLPLIVQMPILIVMWRVIANYEFDQGFLWLRDLSLPDPFYILMVLYVAVNIGQTYMATQGNKDMFRQQLVMQVVFVFFVLTFPSGVTLYWVL
ncbi:MAG TPA: membrane protein insertase YidC, partial [Deinococcales bacterium]|nr:membrane protein insertase YidC [Deinococcales bacterium]